MKYIDYIKLIDHIYKMVFRPSARQLEYFLALAEVGHFGAAARRCNVSQPTLSAQFKLLEDQLGVSLIDRGGGIAALTPAGAALVPLARQAIETLDEIVAVASVRRGGLGGLIRLGVAPTFGPYFMPHLLPHLKQKYPDLDIYIREERPILLSRELQSGGLDCVLAPAPLSLDQAASVVICSEELMLGLPVDHRLADRPVILLEDLDGEGLLSLGQGYQLYQDGQTLCQISGARLLEDYEGTSLDALRQMVSIGMGLALFPAGYIASEFVKEQRVVLKPIEKFPMVRDVILAWRKNSTRADHFQTLALTARMVAGNLEIAGMTAGA